MITATAPVVRVQLVTDRQLAYPTTLAGSDDVANAARELLKDSDREQMAIFHMDSKNRILSVEIVATGSLNATLVHPREVFKGAILANARSIIMAHNHPSGVPTPSPEDWALSKQIIAAGDLVGIQLIDHVVIGDGHVSMRLENPSLGWGS